MHIEATPATGISFTTQQWLLNDARPNYSHHILPGLCNKGLSGL